jgi:hypothetical protein
VVGVTGAQDRALQRLRKKYVSVAVIGEDRTGGDVRLVIRYTRHDAVAVPMILTPTGLLQEPVE